MPSMLSYSSSFTYAPISAIYRIEANELESNISDILGKRTCLTFTITKLSTSGYFSS
jgi:hypothetical protein